MTIKAKLGSPVYYDSIGYAFLPGRTALTFEFPHSTHSRSDHSNRPNPRLVKAFMKEKGIVLPTVTIDLLAGENRQAEYLKKNPAGQMPCLEIDVGVFLAEVVPICEYLSELFPDGPDLIGKTPEERAITRMWLRRIDFRLDGPVMNGFRFAEGYELFKNRVRCMPQASDDLKKLAQEMTLWFDEQMADGRKYIAGDRFTLADLWLYIVLDFGTGFGQAVNPEAKRIHEFMAMMKERPSIKETN
ncbi:hypothetical protein HDU93_000058 [Gonapodya sp. JEL0774]|nr:hypothetical protein HDU93_000058 [Gonapodya sp. JEL0774]